MSDRPDLTAPEEPDAAAPVVPLPAPALQWRSNPIRIYPDMALRAVCREVGEADLPYASRLGARLCEMVAEADALGLAASQVGVGLRLFAFRDHDEQVLAAINPSLELSGPVAAGPEGCMSLGQILLTVERPQRVRMRYLDLAGEECEYEAEGLWAVVLQHEADHLDGRLILDIATDLPPLTTVPYESQVGFLPGRAAATRHLAWPTPPYRPRLPDISVLRRG